MFSLSRSSRTWSPLKATFFALLDTMSAVAFRSRSRAARQRPNSYLNASASSIRVNVTFARS
ncbi:hypothetical protein [Saccharopolyspora gregorii]|uniref:hypothetical protein n=1 Tax=Saccharopolyspora gregorii TaxID=33914 RepID=UPI0031EAAFF4